MTGTATSTLQSLCDRTCCWRPDSEGHGDNSSAESVDKEAKIFGERLSCIAEQELRSIPSILRPVLGKSIRLVFISFIISSKKSQKATETSTHVENYR